MTLRHILKSATTAPREAQKILSMVLAEELLIPSRTVFLAAPWISDIVIFENSVGNFDGLNPEWGHKEIRLIEVLSSIVANNTRLVIRVRPNTPQNEKFKSRLSIKLLDAGLLDLLDWAEVPDFHTKGLLTDRVWIGGSMNFTNNGIDVNAESLIVDFDPEKVAGLRIEFSSYVHE